MCHNVPIRMLRGPAAALLSALLVAGAAFGQRVGSAGGALRPDWRRIGNSAVELYLASPATGPVDRVWFSTDGTRLFALTRGGRVFETQDFENWKPSPSTEPPERVSDAAAGSGARPEPGSKVLMAGGVSTRLYAFGTHVYRSDDGGFRWLNLTRFRRDSIIGEGQRDLAVSPQDADQIVVANDRGVWRSLDGGLSWSGLNEYLPNLPTGRILAAPHGPQGTRIMLAGVGPVEWAPGERQAWRPVPDSKSGSEEIALRTVRGRLGASVSAVAFGELYSYAGATDGRLWVSTDDGAEWRPAASPARGPVTALWVAAGDSRVALATVGSAPDGVGGPRVLRTTNGGRFWDDLTADLPPGAVYGVAADQASGAVYIAAERGIFFTAADLLGPGPASGWIPMGENLPAAPVSGILIDPQGNQLYVAVEGYGVYAAPAPHRFWGVRVVNTADFSSRPAAPGSLLSVIGGRLVRAQAGLLDAPVLHATELESQIQVPFEVSGRSIRLSVEAVRGRFTFDMPLREASPAIFVDRDGSPLLLDGDSGMLLDALNPARPNGRVQILASGLGRVRPPWPTGMAAPLERPPLVVAPVRVMIDGAPVEVLRATLAPGYVGFYLVEIQLPAILNGGPAELRIEAAGLESNRVRIYLEPQTR